MKDSGIDWLGEIPRHWEVSRIGVCVTERRETVSDTDFPALSVTKNGVVPQLDSAAKSDNSEGRKLIRKGDFVINSRSDRKGSSGVSNVDGSCSVVYTVLKLKRFLPAYAHHLFRSQPFQEEFYRWGTGIVDDLWSTRYSSMKQIPVPMPDFDEQRRIADFLDRETAKIDALIAKQEQLITTLDERWNALTSLLISGISARGIQRRVSAVAQFINGFPFDSESFDMFGEVPLVRIRDILSDKFETFVPRSSVPQKAWIRDGDLVIGMDGDFNLTLWDRGAAALNQRVCVLRTAEPVVGSWIAYCLPAELKKINDLTYATTVKHLSSNQIARIMIPMPDLPEMTKAVQELDRENARVGRLLGRIRESLTLLRERRQALISAAVTGKLEVGV